ncbi:MAG: MATE family efflux transporter [Bacteroidales bacterium]|nr:MATE family efflux transporter [Bacteroidales bacterium]
MVPSYNKIWKISYPITLSLLAQNIIIVIDTAFLGHVGEVELGASAIGGLFYLSLFIIGFGFATGSQILIGRRNGEGNFKLIGNYVDHSIYFLLALSVLLTLFAFFFSHKTLGFILSSEAIFDLSIEYLDTRIWGLAFAFVNMAFRAFYIGITNTKYLTYSAVIMAVVNIGLDYTLIFGNFGFEAMGIKGAALASVSAEITSVIFFVSITFMKIERKKYSLFYFPPFNLSVIKKMLDVAFFVMLQFFVSIVSWYMFFMIMEQTGERPLAISNILRGIYMIFTIPIFSLGSATNTMVSNLLGENKPESVIPTIKRFAKISLFSILGLIAIALLFSKSFISFYTDDAGLVQDTLAPYYVIMGVLVIFSVSMIVFNGLTGTGNTKMSLTIEVLSITFYLALAYYLAIILQLPTAIVWFSEFVYFGLLGGLSILYLKFGKWKMKVI